MIKWRTMNLEQEWINAEYNRKNPYVAVVHEMVPLVIDNKAIYSSTYSTSYTLVPQIEWVRQDELELRTTELKVKQKIKELERALNG